MDTNPEGIEVSGEALPYEETTSYEEQLPAPSEPPLPGRSQLADRIGNTKVYLLSETTGMRLGKRKHDDEDGGDNPDGDVEMNEDTSYRENAILFRGSPISHLSTTTIFAYATHFDSRPMALEWIDDTACILVFSSKASARNAYRRLAKSIAEEPSIDDGSVTAKPIPVPLWPPEERISSSLGKGEGLKGAIRMRWATPQDVKKKGAKWESEYYRKYGHTAGKDAEVDEEGDRDRQRKRRRGDMGDELVQKARLDDELDAFLAEEDTTQPPSPPSKMRSDYMGTSGKSLLERTSVMRAQPDTLASRITAQLPHRTRSRRTDDGGDAEDVRRDRHRGEDRRARGERRPPRPRKTQEDLDAELDAFLQSRD
ncbi:hypothetical protein WOLCODRAFT_132039 [Wolfiporia cocos MD-104 SS10]|uniref:Chromatin target of PRMT1 protein C-terminal domain-containing protein n=1 Tax=Wolfiporia cocos (strain MD-104) TaxID=742152 RepID=A0A2H3JIB5_WOLCO|nr:hypothetical protein WOLCODRAFT_132039 [Wolfiporia cocos MD-104 SS10]